MVNRDTIFSVIVILLSIGAYVYVGDLTIESRFFPQVVSVLLIIFNVIHLIKNARPRERKKMFRNIRFDRLIAMAVGLIVYISAMVYIGFVLSSLIFMIFYMWYLNEERKTNGAKVLLKSAILSIFVVGVFYGIFHNLFMIPLPVGLIFGG